VSLSLVIGSRASGEKWQNIRTIQTPDCLAVDVADPDLLGDDNQDFAEGKVEHAEDSLDSLFGSPNLTFEVRIDLDFSISFADDQTLTLGLIGLEREEVVGDVHTETVVTANHFD
jgi:hypothetical protein